MVCLRTVILQDAAILKLKYPKHEIFMHPIFKTKLFLDFSDSVLKCVNAAEDVNLNSLRDLNPVIAEALVNMDRNLSQKLGQINENTIFGLKRIEDLIDYSFRKRLKISINADWEKNSESAFQMEEQQAQFDTVENEKAGAGDDLIVTGAKVNRSVKTITQAYQEWRYGIKGYSSIENLDRTFNAS